SRRRSYSAAARVLKSAQLLDPNRSELSDRLRRLTDHARTARARRRSTLRALVFAAGFLLMFFVYGRYSRSAMEEYASSSIEDFMVTGRFEEGREFYDHILTSYPLTIPF